MIYSIFLSLLAIFFSPPIPAHGSQEIIICATGDIMPAGSALPFVQKHGHHYPYLAARKILQSGDIVIGNLETPLAEKGEKFADKKYTFKAPVASAGALKEAGFTHVTLANNHMMDFGASGLASTLMTLDTEGILHAGAGKDIDQARIAAFTTVKGRKVALLAYSNTFPAEFYATKTASGTAPGYRNHVISDVRREKERAELLIVSFHWGAELRQHPKEYQKELARLAIDEGANIVLGHHPHVLQGVEYYGKGIIFYSLGNFAFGSYSKSVKESIIARIVFRDGEIARAEAIPLNVDNYEVHFRPTPAVGEEGRRIIDGLAGISESLGSHITYEGDRGVIERGKGPTP